MLKTNRHLFTLFLFCSATTHQVRAQELYPLKPQNTPKTITGVVGELASSTRIHAGVDMIGDTKVYATIDGIAHIFKDTGNYSSHVQIGNKYYIHINAKSTIIDGRRVSVGEEIGTMITDNPILPRHVHLQEDESTAQNRNLLPYLTSFKDLSKPSIKDVKFFNNGINKSTSAPDLNRFNLKRQVVLFGSLYTVLYNKIDIIVKAEDTRTDENGSSAGGATAPYKISYKILDQNKNRLGDSIEYIRFATKPSDANLRHIYTIFSNRTNHQFIVTNYPFDIIKQDRYWNLGLRKGLVEDWPGNNNKTLDARYPGESFYPEDIYSVRITVNDTANTNDLSKFNREHKDFNIIADNFMPYIERIDLVQEGNTPYKESWIWDESQSKLILSPSIHPIIVGGKKDLVIKVQSSEPMKDLFIGSANIPISPQPLVLIPNTNDRRWEFKVTAAQLSRLTTNIVRISFTGHDYADNQLLKHAGDNMPIRQLNGSWLPAPDAGADENFQFAFCAKPTNFHNTIVIHDATGLDWNGEAASYNQFIYNSSFNWVSCTKTYKPNYWKNLKPSTEYKIKMSKNCEVNRFTVVSAESDVITFTTHKQPSEEKTSEKR